MGRSRGQAPIQAPPARWSPQPTPLLPAVPAVQLEMVGACGSVVIWVLAGAVVIRSSVDGLPALQSGDWPVVGFTTLCEMAVCSSGEWLVH